MMDLKNEHTQKKLHVWKAYLEKYLAVLSHVKFFRSIYIIEPFAGEGRDDKGNQGSALISAEVINNSLKNSQKIELILNEFDKKKFNFLKENLDSYKKFTSFFQEKGDDFLQEVINSKLGPETHSLFFIDPYGYTQYSADTLSKLLSLKRADYLIFMPTTHIYRFSDVPDGPAKKFLLDLGITENPTSEDEFVEELKEIFIKKLKSKSNFVYFYKLKNIANNYHLFFISKNPRGAEKFLEAIATIKEEMPQLLLFNLDEEIIKNKLKKFLCQERTNEELYIESLKWGKLAKEILPLLKELEDSGNLEIEAEFKRPKGAFYLNLKQDEKTISIKYNE